MKLDIPNIQVKPLKQTDAKKKQEQTYLSSILHILPTT